VGIHEQHVVKKVLEVEEVAQHGVDSEEDVKGMRTEESFQVLKRWEEDQETCLQFVKYPKALLRPGRSNSGHVTPQPHPRLSRPAPLHGTLDLRYSDHVTPIT
jgi:hypothetical protein